MPKGEKHQAGVGFAIKTSSLHQFEFLPKGINSCLMSLRVSLSHDRLLHLSVPMYRLSWIQMKLKNDSMKT